MTYFHAVHPNQPPLFLHFGDHDAPEIGFRAPMAGFILSCLFSLIGFSYFVYGKKATDAEFLVAGVLLMAFPYFVSGPWMMAGIGVALTVYPFAYRRWAG